MNAGSLVNGELIPLSSGTFRHSKIRDLVGHLQQTLLVEKDRNIRDIAVEVLSPSERAIYVRRRVSVYLRAGSKEV